MSYEQIQHLMDKLPAKAWEDPEFVEFTTELCNLHATFAWKETFDSCDLFESLGIKGHEGNAEARFSDDFNAPD